MFNNDSVFVYRDEFKENFVGIHTPTFFSAFEDLSKDGFRMFVFFSTKKNNNRFIFHFNEARTQLNATDEQINNGIKELIEKHYLVKNNALYDFHQTPLSDDEVAFFNAPRRNPLNIDF